MNSAILQIAAKYIRLLLVFFAVLALLRGHNNPGGGFIGGLLVALSIVYYGFAFDSMKAKAKLNIQPERYIASGLLAILLSVLPGLVQSGELMKGIWIGIPLPVLGELKLGTPFLFDIGVFLAVIGVTLMFFFSLTKTEQWK
jgi:multicomponent Na+:H+ antiporter subunit B